MEASELETGSHRPLAFTIYRRNESELEKSAERPIFLAVRRNIFVRCYNGLMLVRKIVRYSIVRGGTSCRSNLSVLSLVAARVARAFSRGPYARTCRTRVARKNPASSTNGREIDVSIVDTRNAWRWA